MNIFDVKDILIIITGGHDVLGSGIPRHLLKCNAKVTILARNEAKAKDFANRFSPTNALGIKAGVLDKDNLKRTKNQLLD